MDASTTSLGTQWPRTLSQEKFTEIVARKVTDKIVSLLIVTDEIQATACKEVVAEIVEDIKKHEERLPETPQQNPPEKPPGPLDQKALAEEQQGTKTGDVSREFWSPACSDDPFVKMSAAEWKRLGDVFL